MTMRVLTRAWGTSTTFPIPLYDSANPETLLTGIGFVASDVQVSQDGGAFSNSANTPTEIASTGIYTLELSATETEADNYVIVKFVDGTNSWMDAFVMIDITAYRTSADIMAIYQVDAATYTPTSTACEADILLGTEQTDENAYKDRQIVWLDSHSVAFIESSTAGTSGRLFTFTENPTGAPSNGNRFVIL